MQSEQRQRAFTAFQEFLNTPLEERLQQPQHPSPETVKIALFQNVAATVPAYQTFLAQHNINPASIQTFEDFQKLPLITKDNYLRPHPLAELCRGGKLEPAISLPFPLVPPENQHFGRVSSAMSCK